MVRNVLLLVTCGVVTIMASRTSSAPPPLDARVGALESQMTALQTQIPITGKVHLDAAGHCLPTSVPAPRKWSAHDNVSTAGGNGGGCRIQLNNILPNPGATAKEGIFLVSESSTSGDPHQPLNAREVVVPFINRDGQFIFDVPQAKTITFIYIPYAAALVR